MGLTPQYKAKQEQVSQANEKLLIGKFNHIKALNKTIPINLIIGIFPFLFLLVVQQFFEVTQNILLIWIIFENLQEIFKCFWDYGEYSSSLFRVNHFLQLAEKQENLQGQILTKELKIKSINFEKVSFKYQGNPQWILQNYTDSFTKGQVNYLLGKNGSGKSTILYLILGICQPQKGQIWVLAENNQKYKLQELNLKNWREKKLAYVSHDNLFEEGSTGQRQLANLREIFAKKDQASVFLFDEADNALDKINQTEFENNLKNLAQSQLVIYAKPSTNNSSKI